MFIQDLMLCLQLTVDNFESKNSSECLLHLPCGCLHPGKELCCENCEYLEACLSQKQMLERKQATCAKAEAVTKV
ncbi:hypothetical protein SAMD00079811_54550 [Scytonema sp. HK-05]|uniref:hypothetical protein n=1 Tax=Scytonema sp. HK-05 TaxID=1137095 RepID=UPI000937714B|nr:hypothetical protein [Scytonema sp. HK-05]OKH59748.1 hypothetical protein NIES2130_07795 [Scytonema sp. HK-05]BAY47836.1 hypothetical protein SAMD00079811_54550 [Scytonema sp. HK-05]